MIAVVTRQNPDGTYDEVGMRNRRVTAEYSSKQMLLKHGLPRGWQGSMRIELFANADAMRASKPKETFRYTHFI